MVAMKPRRVTPGKPAAAAATMTMSTIPAGMMARKPKSLLSPSVETRSQETTRPVPARQAKVATASFSARERVFRKATVSAIVPATKAAGSSSGRMTSQ